MLFEGNNYSVTANWYGSGAETFRVTGTNVTINNVTVYNYGSSTTSSVRGMTIGGDNTTINNTQIYSSHHNRKHLIYIIHLF